MRNNFGIGFATKLLLMGGCLTNAERAPPSSKASRALPHQQPALSFLQGGPKVADRASSTVDNRIPFLRGGSASATTTATKSRTASKKKARHPVLIVGKNVKEGLDKLGGKMQRDIVFVTKNIGRGFAGISNNTRKFVANIPKIRLPPPIQLKLPFLGKRGSLKTSKKLDDVCNSFSSVLSGSEVDTAQLLKACRAHLNLMKSGGPSLRLVAKDLESNVQKAERAYKKSPKEGRRLSSLLESEKARGLHNGDELHEKSAAMGLLWIRRSLAFQCDLYASLLTRERHPRDAAYSAYAKHLSPFHGWALRKVFPASLSQMPKRDVFIATFGEISEEELNDEYDKMIIKKIRALLNAWDPLLRTWEGEYERLGLEDMRRV